MRFPDPNVGYVFGYKSRITREGILVTFLREWVKIWFRFDNIDRVRRETYRGGRISWDVIRWGKCPPGQEALRVCLREGAFKHHLVVFDDLDAAIDELRSRGRHVE
jgi:hypothetical protein